MAQNGVADYPHAGHVPHDSALSVGSSTKEEDVARIRDLEDEVRHLADKANAASQKFADYENEIRVLEAKLRQEQRKNPGASETPDISPVAANAMQRPGISRFGSFMGGARKNEQAQSNGTLQTPGAREKDLEEKLVKEQTARIAAEKSFKEVSAELEDLSATLFQQANEMVATEKKANAALKFKIAALEKQRDRGATKDFGPIEKENTRLKEKLKTLEQRDVERKKRLERLDAANKRIERVKALLQPP